MWTNEWFDKKYMNVEFVNDKKKQTQTFILLFSLILPEKGSTPGQVSRLSPLQPIEGD